MFGGALSAGSARVRISVKMCSCAATCGGCLILCGVQIFAKALWAGALEEGLGRGCVCVCVRAEDFREDVCASAAVCGVCLVFGGVEVFAKALWAGACEQVLERGCVCVCARVCGCVRVLLLVVSV